MDFKYELVDLEYVNKHLGEIYLVVFKDGYKTTGSFGHYLSKDRLWFYHDFAWDIIDKIESIYRRYK